MDHGRAAAVHEIRRAQKHARQKLGLADIAIEEGVLDAALEAAGRREQAAVVKGDRVRESAFSYPLELEKKRWARTRDIIHGVAPGPNEDARYLEMVARQAASIEMMLRGEHREMPNPRTTDLCDRVLIATIPSFSPAAETYSVKGYFNVLLAAGLIQFVYQVAKFVVLSWDISQDESGPVRAKGTPEDIDRVLAENPRLLRRLLDTYIGYLFRGDPRQRRRATRAPHRQAEDPCLSLDWFIVVSRTAEAADVIDTVLEISPQYAPYSSGARARAMSISPDEMRTVP
jgi:hypothetical protein